MNRNILFLCISLAALSPTHAAAEDDSPDTLSAQDVTAAPSMQLPATWTFDDCVRWATANSTDMRRSLLNILQADQDIYSAKDAWLPTVGFSTSHTFNNYPSPSGTQSGNVYSSSYGINANWTVWEGNVRKYQAESAKILRQQQQLASEDVEKSLKLGILQAYLNILYAREAVTIAEQTLEVSTSQTERARKLMESGRTSQVDYAQIESQSAQDAYSLEQAKSNYETARMALKKILELGLDYDLDIADVSFDDDEVAMPLPAMDDVYAAAQNWLPELRSNELSRDLYATDVKIAKAGRMPTINLTGGLGSGYTSGGAGWGMQMKHSFGENIGLSVSVPLFDGNSTKRKVAKAKLASLEYDLDRKSLLDNLSQTIENLYVEAKTARAKYSSGTVQLNAAQLTDKLTNRQFELGLVNPLELLTSHNNLLNARLELLISKYMAILANKTIMYYATQEVSVK